MSFVMRTILALGLLAAHVFAAPDGGFLAVQYIGQKDFTAQYDSGVTAGTMLPLQGLGYLLWTELSKDLFQKGFLHEKYSGKAGDLESESLFYEQEMLKAQGAVLFGKYPWTVFTESEWGPLVWESSKQRQYDPQRAYLKPQGWLRLAGLLCSPSQSGWVLHTSDTGFVACHHGKKIAMAGSWYWRPSKTAPNRDRLDGLLTKVQK
jgi:hypothetical protein